MVVGNKSDKRREVSTQEGQSLAEQVLFNLTKYSSLYTETSALTTFGVTDLFTTLVDEILNTADVKELAAGISLGVETGTGGGSCYCL